MRIVSIILALFTVVTLCACENLFSDKKNQESIWRAANKAADCEQMLLNDGFSPDPRYSTSLDKLLEVDATLTDNPQITFVFGKINTSGYQFTVMRAGSRAAAICDVPSDCRMLPKGITRR